MPPPFMTGPEQQPQTPVDLGYEPIDYEPVDVGRDDELLCAVDLAVRVVFGAPLAPRRAVTVCGGWALCRPCLALVLGDTQVCVSGGWYRVITRALRAYAAERAAGRRPE
jgi:hypothetical protein